MKFLLSAILLPVMAICCFAQDELTRGVDFIRSHMPERDKNLITNERIKKEVKLALDAREQFPWAKKTPWDIYENNVLPYATVTEERDEWREAFHKKFSPVVAECKTASEATLAIASNIEKMLGVKYSTERRIPHQGVNESIRLGMASCTGRSILLIAALRSVGIPARMAGVLTWNHIRGNHNWVEAWCDGEWKMIEYNDKDFNAGWVLENISKLDPNKWQNKIFATSWKPSPTGDFFPMVWEMKVNALTNQAYFPPEARCIHGEDVSARYADMTAELRAKLNRKGSSILVEITDASNRRQRLHVALKGPDNKIICKGTTPGPHDDVRNLLELFLPENVERGTIWIALPDGKFHKIPVTHDKKTPVRELRLKMNIPEKRPERRPVTLPNYTM